MINKRRALEFQALFGELYGLAMARTVVMASSDQVVTTNYLGLNRILTVLRSRLSMYRSCMVELEKNT